MGRADRQRRYTMGYVVLMAVLGSLVFIAPRFDSLAWAGVGACGTAGVVLGIFLVRPQRPGAWWALAAALVATTLGNVFYGLATPPRLGPVALADISYLLMFPIIATALIGLTRATAVLEDRSSLIDLLALTCSALLSAWVFIVSPRLASDGVSATDWSVRAVYSLGDILVLVVTVRLVTAARRNAAAILLAVGAFGMLAEDVAYGVAESHGGLAPGGPADLGYVLLFTTWGAAALQPSMARLTAPAEGPPRQLREPMRGLGMAALLISAAFMPLALGYETITGDIRDGAVIAVAFGLTLALLVVRLSDAVGRHAAALRRERALRQAGMALVGAADSGAVATAVRAAIRTLLPAGAKHDIVVDFSLTDLLPLGEVSLARVVPVTQLPPHWSNRLAGFGHAIVCPLDAGVLYIGGDRRDLLATLDAVSILAGQAALALTRISLTEATSRRDSDGYLRAVTEHSNDVVLVLDDDQRIRYTSPSVADVLGIWPTPLATLHEIIAPADREQVVRTLKRARTGESDTTRDSWSLRRPDGTRVFVEAVFRDLRDDRLVRGMVVTLHDITDQRRAEHELLRRTPSGTPTTQNHTPGKLY
ncbi:PAS domain S-box protein [Dactylosporangium sp. NPDC005572]|uniref:PAS domain-containing protein n=1 Tax=Dactylosporangium sp. NPDC005572 TaxID=3156889 RepID=UPI0033BBE77E